jgi:hypothetical protein
VCGDVCRTLSGRSRGDVEDNCLQLEVYGSKRLGLMDPTSWSSIKWGWLTEGQLRLLVYACLVVPINSMSLGTLSIRTR